MTLPGQKSYLKTTVDIHVMLKLGRPRINITPVIQEYGVSVCILHRWHLCLKSIIVDLLKKISPSKLGP